MPLSVAVKTSNDTILFNIAREGFYTTLETSILYLPSSDANLLRLTIKVFVNG